MPLTSSELSQMVMTCAKFVHNRIRPIEQQVDDSGNIDASTWRALKDESIELGLYTANVPSHLGGPGLTIGEQIALWEAFGLTSWPFTYLLARPHRILFECSEEQR